MEIGVGTDDETISVRERTNALGQFMFLGQRRARDDDRDNRHLKLERRLNFHPDEVIRFLKTVLPMLISDGKPSRTDDHKDGISTRQSCAQ
jgi:hypothetical protein